MLDWENLFSLPPLSLFSLHYFFFLVMEKKITVHKIRKVQGGWVPHSCQNSCCTGRANSVDLAVICNRGTYVTCFAKIQNMNEWTWDKCQPVRVQKTAMLASQKFPQIITDCNQRFQSDPQKTTDLQNMFSSSKRTKLMFDQRGTQLR